MAAVTSAVIAAGALAHSVEQSNTMKRKVKRDLKFKQGQERRAEAKRRSDEKIADMSSAQRKMRQKQQNKSVFGREGTILGGSPSAGNVGGQTTGSGKTLLGT